MQQSITINYEELESINELSSSDKELLLSSFDATNLAYAPYSNFKVGAAAKLSDQLLLTHFCQVPIIKRKYAYGSLAILADWEVCKWICIDADSKDQIEAVHRKILPALNQYGILPLVESSREGRMHIWFMTNISPSTAEKFMLQLFAELELIQKTWEIYPLFQRRRAIIRVPGGHHFKSGRVHGVFVNGVETSNACDIMQAFINLPIYEEAFISSKLKSIDIAPQVEVKKTGFRKKFVYTPVGLEPPASGLPGFIGKLASNCQSINKLIYDTINNDLIEERGVLHHDSGLALSHLALSQDYITQDSQGSDWFDSLREEYRSRDDSEHNWQFNKDPGLKVWKCSTLDQYFQSCEGCPVRHRIESPKQFYFGLEVKGELIEPYETE
jgi:hypothetical protein